MLLKDSSSSRQKKLLALWAAISEHDVFLHITINDIKGRIILLLKFARKKFYLFYHLLETKKLNVWKVERLIAITT